MRVFALALCLCASLPALAQELPQFPKAGPPGSLPEPLCDTALANNGEWLVGRWVSPQSRWEFHRQGTALVWSLERKGSINDGLGWSEGTRFDGNVDAVSGCTFSISAGGGQFVMEGVLTDGGKVFGVAANAKGNSARFILRRER
ncbi:hypothetical protein [Magnetospirillum sulfuroxidans]|uniref:Protease inhibitor Inh n=1 Tax=Magnetospirillum sulfuroxidans TaxID=611300 RepID=A0ABS5I9Y8_9PROT|nr:hypothetical protein [Magnetospirillum sulfuroxidans]MBR9971246.1 hypothetical protein [Magnetospirillum sulfuroxidans]